MIKVTILSSIGYGQLSLLTDKGKITLICYGTIGEINFELNLL